MAAAFDEATRELLDGRAMTAADGTGCQDPRFSFMSQLTIAARGQRR